MTRIAFIGLGNMGGLMAANLAKAQHQVTGFDLAPASLAAEHEHSGRSCRNLSPITSLRAIIQVTQTGDVEHLA